MRVRVFIALAVLMLALAICAIVAYRSKKPMSKSVCWLLVSLLPPMIGNSMLIISGDWLVSRIGCYLYYLGLDWSVMALLHFTGDYCKYDHRKTVASIASGFALVDMVQLLVNIFTQHAFTTEMTMVEGFVYWSLVPGWGQTFHRMVAYGIFGISLVIFAVMTNAAPRIYKERYAVILIAMVIVGLWETYYIVSGAPIDRSMIGFGVFGLLVFYFALYYKPFRLLDRMLAQVVSTIDEAVFFFDRNKACIYANAAGERVFGIKGEQDLALAVERMRSIVGEREFDLGRAWSCQRTTGEGEDTRYWDVEYRLMHDDRGELVGAFLTAHDRTDEERNLQVQRFNATHDSLTGLYNKERLYQRAREVMDANPDISWSVIALDVREFKLVNDTYGKEVGDSVLRHIGQLISGAAQPNEVYGRISGDKFGSVLPTSELNPEAMRADLDTRREYGEARKPVTVHAGIYEVTEPELEVSAMFDRAFMAIETIKNDFSRHLAFYDARLREEAIWNQKIAAELDNAIASGQIRPYLQPMVDDAGKVRGAEVLVRWIHPEDGFLAPYRFIPFFEENGRIAQLDRYMWECACRILRSWDDAGIDLFLSVNISPKDFYFMDVVGTISGLVKQYGIRPERLRLEITETIMMSDVDNRLRILSDLRSRGFLVEMDDFGSGYSSLNMLKDMPVDVLKIDMMFLYKSENQQRAQTILQTIVKLSRDLQIPSITEGVETADQLRMLVAMGCHLFQGYYFAKPMPLEEFEESYVKTA